MGNASQILSYGFPDSCYFMDRSLSAEPFVSEDVVSLSGLVIYLTSSLCNLRNTVHLIYPYLSCTMCGNKYLEKQIVSTLPVLIHVSVSLKGTCAAVFCSVASFCSVLLLHAKGIGYRNLRPVISVCLAAHTQKNHEQSDRQSFLLKQDFLVVLYTDLKLFLWWAHKEMYCLYV